MLSNAFVLAKKKATLSVLKSLSCVGQVFLVPEKSLVEWERRWHLEV